MSTIEDMEYQDVEDIDLERFEENDEVEGGGVEQEGAEGGENEAADDANKTAVKPKRVIRNPQPKLNVETLKGKRGLVALESHFERVKFKGRGHEEEDLSVILKTYEYWCHRLFPKYPFDECVSKIESLGNKRPAVTYIKRLRADLPYDYGPEVVNENDDSDNEGVPNSEENDFGDLLEAPEAQPLVEISEEQLERIRLNKERAERIRREKHRQERELPEASGSQNSCSAPDDSTDCLFEEAISQMEVLKSQDGSRSQTGYISENESNNDFVENCVPISKDNEFGNLSEAPEAQPPVEINEQQLERIRLNKERAERIRRDKLRQKRELPEASVSQKSCSLLDENTECVFEEAISQVEVLESQDGSSNQTGHISENESNDFVENRHSSQVELCNNGENDHLSSAELEKISQDAETEAENDHEENCHNSQQKEKSVTENPPDDSSPMPLTDDQHMS